MCSNNAISVCGCCLLYCCWITWMYIAICIPLSVSFELSFLYPDSYGSIATNGDDYIMVDLCSDKQFLVSRSKQCTVANSIESNNITMVTANCKDIHLQTESIYNISNGYRVKWLTLHTYLYIINKETATVTYNITIEPAELNTTIQGRVLVFDNEEDYFRSQQETNDARYIKEVMVTQLTQLVTVTFPRNRTIYFIALQIEKGTIDQVSVTSKVQKSYYSVNGLANKTCLDSTKCKISFGKEECTLVKTSSITELDIKAEKYKGLFWTLLPVEIICLCLVCCLCCIFKKKAEKQWRRRGYVDISPDDDQDRTTGRPTEDDCEKLVAVTELDNTHCHKPIITELGAKDIRVDDDQDRTTVEALSMAEDCNELVVVAKIDDTDCHESIITDLHVEAKDCHFSKGDNTIDHITQVLVQILCLNCYQFGRALNLSDSEISHIASKCGMNNQESMRAILSKWSHKNNNNVSWRAVVQALRDSDQPRLADMITMCYIDTPETMDITETIPLQVPSISLNDPPTMKMLLENVATKIATKWETFGIMVELESEVINIIKSEQTKEVLRMMEVFQQWQCTNRPPFTWNTVIETLRTDALREKTLAQTLIHDLITDATSTAL